jgi:hypothetical protein
MATEGNSSVASVAIVVIVVIAAIVFLLTIRNAEDDPDLEIDLPEIEVNELNPPEGASPQELWHIG